MTSEPPKKEGYIARRVRLAREIRRQPGIVVPWLRRWVANLWQARGGGFYGLGYVVAFVLLEAKALGGSVSTSRDVSGFVSGLVADQLIGFVLRFSFESLLNVFLALLWPFYVLERFGALGVIALIAGYLGFEYLLRPSIEAWFPELAQAHEQRVRRKREKQERRRLKRTPKEDARSGERH